MLYYVMKPQDGAYFKWGNTTSNLGVAVERARKCGGRAYSYDGCSRLVGDFEVEAEPEKKMKFHEFQQARGAAALFGVTRV